MRTLIGSSQAVRSRRGSRLSSFSASPIEDETALISQTLSFALRRTQLAVSADLHQSLAEVSLRPIQFAALALIADSPGASQGHVSDALGMEKANFVAIVTELEQRGLLVRRKSSFDARIHELTLTAAGKELTADAFRYQEQHESRLTAALGETSRQELLRILAQLYDAM